MKSHVGILLNQLVAKWDAAEGRSPCHKGEFQPLRVRSWIENAGSRTQEQALALPHEFAVFRASRLHLFEDITYGQWGLTMGPSSEFKRWTEEFMEERCEDARTGDVIVGRFRGDCDLLLLRNDPRASDFGQLLVVLPLDERQEWYFAGRNLLQFLRKYVEQEGAKFWEVTQTASE